MHKEFKTEKDLLKETVGKNVFRARYVSSSNESIFTYMPHDKIDDFLTGVSINGAYYVNEFITKKQMCKPYLILNKLFDDESTMLRIKSMLITEMAFDIKKVFLNNYGETLSPYDVVWSDCSKQYGDKYRLNMHIVVAPRDFTYCYGNSECHLATELHKLDPIWDNYIDQEIWGDPFCLKILGSGTSHSDRHTLVPIDPLLLLECSFDKRLLLRSLITYIPPNLPEKRLESPMTDKQVVEKLNRTEVINLVLPMHPTAYLNDIYRNFYTFGYMDPEEPCPIAEEVHEFVGFYCYTKDSKAYLKCKSKECKKIKGLFLGNITKYDPFLERAIKLKKDYLCKDPITRKVISKWWDNHKCLIVKSAMGTGKTWLIEEILKNYDPKKVLWITHRQSLTNNLHGKFEKYHFVSYLEKEGYLGDLNRVIVQLDSIYRIVKTVDYIRTYQQYDLVIMDEVEGLMAHFNSPHLNRKGLTARKYFDTVERIVSRAKKLLVLDADVGDRTRVFTEDMDCLFIHNLHEQDPKRLYRAYNDRDIIIKSIKTSIKDHKNIAIVSMSSDQLDELEQMMIKMKVKYIKYTSRTDDEKKKGLKEVNKSWSQYQVVMYSPTIESGVDFTAKHFDRIYGIISCGANTCTPRAFFQMMGRIRKVANPLIECYYPRMPVDEKDGNVILNSNCFTYRDTVKSYKHQEVFNGHSIFQLVDLSSSEMKDGRYVLERAVLQKFDKLMMYTIAEEWNKTMLNSATVFDKLARLSGSLMEFVHIDLKEKRKTKQKTDKEAKIKQKKLRLSAIAKIDASGYLIDELTTKRKREGLTELEKLVVEKYFYTIRLPDLSLANTEMQEEMLECYDTNKGAIGNAELITDRRPVDNGKCNSSDDDYNHIRDPEDYMYSIANNRTRVNIIKNLINCFLNTKEQNFNNIEFEEGIAIDHKAHHEGISRVMKSEYFTHEEIYRPLFYKSKGKTKNGDSEEDRSNFSQAFTRLIKGFGLRLESNQIMIEGERQYDYKLKFDEQILTYVKMIHGQPNKLSERIKAMNQK